jgi:hypothetical protein
MSKQPSRSNADPASSRRDDLRRILGDVDDAKIIEILALGPSLTELEEAAMWAAGDGDFLAKSGRPLAGVVAQVVDILTADEEEPPPMR